MENEEKRVCENCAWYLRHYIKQAKQFKAIYVGHCGHSDIRKKAMTLCNRWEPMKIAKEKKVQSIRRYLISVSNQLKKLVEVLKDDIEHTD